MIKGNFNLISDLATLVQTSQASRILMPVSAPDCRGKMENYFKEKKRFIARRKRYKESERLAPTTETSQSGVEQVSG